MVICCQGCEYKTVGKQHLKQPIQAVYRGIEYPCDRGKKTDIRWCYPIPLTDFPCDKCGAQCVSELQLEIQKRNYHALRNAASVGIFHRTWMNV